MSTAERKWAKLAELVTETRVQIEAEVAHEVAMLNGALGLALRDRDRDRERIAELEADVADLTGSAQHWHDLAEHYVVKARQIARALDYIGGAETEAAESELRNATPAWRDPQGNRPTVEGLADHSGFTDPPLTESSVPARRQQPRRVRTIRGQTWPPG